MAAIVSQLAAANRRRKEALKRPVIPSEKCVYILPPFDPCFKPEVHNRYMRQKKAVEDQQKFVEKVGPLNPVHIEQLNQMGQKRLQVKTTTTAKASEEDNHSKNNNQEQTEEAETFEMSILDKSEAGAVEFDFNIPAQFDDENLAGFEEPVSEAETEVTKKSARPKKEHKKTEQICRVIIAILCLMSLMPLVALVIYLVGIFAYI